MLKIAASNFLDPAEIVHRNDPGYFGKGSVARNLES